MKEPVRLSAALDELLSSLAPKCHLSGCGTTATVVATCRACRVGYLLCEGHRAIVAGWAKPSIHKCGLVALPATALIFEPL